MVVGVVSAGMALSSPANAQTREPRPPATAQQTAALEYEGLSRDEIFTARERFYKAYYFRPRPIARIVGEMLVDWDVMKRRLREGAEFLRFLRLRSAGA